MLCYSFINYVKNVGVCFNPNKLSIFLSYGLNGCQKCAKFAVNLLM